MVVKNIIAEDMPFTKSHFEQFWRSYCKKKIFVVFHFLKFLPIYVYAQPALSVTFGREISYDQKSKNEDLMKNTIHRCNSLEICRGRALSPNGSEDNSYLCHNHI